MATIEFDKMSFQYKGAESLALNDLSLSVEKGDFIGIIGASGAGKSTFTYAINGIVPHHFEGDFYGSIKVAGMDTVDNEPEKLALHVGNVFQDIDAQMTANIVEDEILFGLENFGIPHDEIEQRISDSLEALGITELRTRDISTLSGGQKQKVAICAMLALQPEILVLDEPTGELDPQSSRQIFTILRELNEKQGMTIVIVEQKIMLLCEFAKKLLVMDKGCVVFYDDVREVLQQSKRLEELGINIPRVVTLSNSLAEMGLYSGIRPVSTDEAAIMVRGIIGG